MKLLRLIGQGLTSSKALAKETGLQPRSIDTYLHAAARKLGCANRTAAAARFAQMERETSQSPSQLTPEAVATPQNPGSFGVARTIRWAVTRLPLGGSPHNLSPAGVAMATLYVSVLGLGGLLLVVLLVLGILRTFRTFINI